MHRGEANLISILFVSSYLAVAVPHRQPEQARCALGGVMQGSPLGLEIGVSSFARVEDNSGCFEEDPHIFL